MFSDSICGPQLVPPTQKSAKYVFIIKIIMFFQLIIAILDIVAARSFLRQGIFGLFFLILLYMAYYKLSYYCILIYTFASLFFTVVFLVYVLTIIQRGPEIEIENLSQDWPRYYLAVACISFIFYLINTVFCFYPYREFKTIEFFENPVLNEMMGAGSAENLASRPNNIDVYAVDYGMNEADKSKKPKSSFEVFKGQGVRIG